MDYYKLNVCGVERNLPIIQISDNLKIASFVLLGDTELATKAGGEVVQKLAILAEGDAAKRDDIIFLEKLPIFEI
ncbi:MAG: hypothetical protein E7I76_06865 [Anaerococcus vaginalis]|uniref:hypothetical protein n=1 Tax=Anaerococcus vaginalis TaxID=33037 RepID=UPI0029098CFC|nr:hypothetical protein [Anaerococcus vaginalis]